MPTSSPAVAPMVAMVTNPSLGLLGIFGAAIAAGLITILIAPFISRLLPLFPPVVTGTIILMIGISLMRVGVNWAAGAPAPTLPGYGDPIHLGVALAVLLLILAITKYGRGFVGNIAVLLGIVAGCVLAWAIGKMGFAKVASASWFGLITPFSFGMPTFDLVAIVTMTIVMIVVMIESTGMFLAVGEMTGRPVDTPALTRGLRTDGLATIIGGVFNTFPYTSYSQNVGLVGVTGVRSRWVCALGGVIMLAMGLIPKLGALVESVPLFVLGGAGIVMFGMVAATGIRILTAVDFAGQRNNLVIVAIAIGFGMSPRVALAPILESGILLAAIVAVLLNLYFNGARGDGRAQAAADARATGLH